MPQKYSLKIHPNAIDELETVYRFIANDKKTAAKRFVGELKKKIRGLSLFPRRGASARKIVSSLENVRFISHKGYLIFYEVRGSEVLVLHITAPGQDWITLFL